MAFPDRAGRSQLGVVLPILGKTIALARIDMAQAYVATALELGKLNGQQKRLPSVSVLPLQDDAKKI